MKKIVVILITLSAITLLAARVGLPAETKKVPFAEPAGGEQINWQVVSSGGTRSISAGYILEGTAGQTAVAPCSTETYIVNSGFWQNFGCCLVPGDANNSGAVNILDVSYLINYLYKGGSAPVCMPEADADGSGAVNLLDVTRLINYLYKGGSAPVCGPEPWPEG